MDLGVIVLLLQKFGTFSVCGNREGYVLVMMALCSCFVASRRALVDDIERSILERHEHWKTLHRRGYTSERRNASMCLRRMLNTLNNSTSL
ncbi:hypothetical protein Scep_022146 [Stephania cephalantha]|uniref:Uncharacterized protein n=1 Tax=Stephania cephalantha TaxID=152367 RepID=A0AAP0FAB8_9MAGN